MTTQDKPAVGPLSAGDLPLLVKGDLLRRQNGTVATVVTANPEAFRTEHGLNSKGMARNFAFIGRPGPDGWIPWSGGENPVPGQEVEVRYRSFDCVREPPFIRHHGSEGPANRYYWANDGSSGDIIAFRLAPTAPADVSTKPLETNTSAEHVKETAKNEHVTAPVEAGGWDEAKLIAYEDAHAVAVEMGYPSLTEALEHLAALRPQPSGETREAVARLTKDVATVKSFSANAATFYDGPNRRYIGDVAADIETVLALLSARPLALGGQQGEDAAWSWLNQHVECDPADRDYSADEMVDAFIAGSGRYDIWLKALERIAGEQQYRSGYCQTDITVEPALTAEEAQTVARDALSTTPARAEAPSDDLRTACKAVLDDYQTSDAHHPDHVLIRRTDFDRIKALVEAPVVARAEAQDEDTPCTDCGDTGVTHQTERRCSCQEAEAQVDGAEMTRLLKLADSALANVTAFEDDARYIMGNTNYAITENARSEIRSFLLAQSAKTSVRPKALEILERLLDHSGARGSFDAMKHGDAVKDAEELLRSARSPGHTDLMVTPESIDAYMRVNPMEAQDEGAAGIVTAKGGQWEPHTGQDYAVVMLPDENTETASIHVYGDDEGLPQRIADAALRPQPSGETLQSLAQAFEDAMEGSHGAWAVSGDEGPLSATTVADKIQADTDAKLTDCPSGETREAVLKGVGKINGDGWKDTTTEGEIVFVWNAEKPAPYAPGQYPRVGNEGWSASTSQYDFTPATADDVPAIIALLSARPAPVASSDQPEQGALEVVAWPVVTDQWTETYCELTGRDPDGKQVTFVDGATVTTFRDMAKREIEAMLCAAPKAAVRAIAALTPPAEPVSRPAEEGEREAVARIIDPSAFLFAPDELPKGSRAQYDAFDKADRIIALLRPAAPDAGGGDTLKQAAIVAKNMADNASYNINQAGVTQENATYDRAFVEIYNVLDRALQPGGER